MSESVDAQSAPVSRSIALWQRRRYRRQQGPRSKASRVTESAAVIILAMAVYLLIGEMAVRLVVHAPLFEIRDFRHERFEHTVNRAVEYDSALGWHLRPQIKCPPLTTRCNTLQYGFRSNGGPNSTVRPGGVLAVGSSFTAGSEVDDDQTWPAQLEQMTGWNVNNAGEGGYVADQIIMNAEQLLPIIHPQVLVVDLIPDNIIGASYSAYGWPKPYFTVENGKLVQHNKPVPKQRDSGRDRFGIKPFLGHFAIADQFMAAFFSNSWFSSDGSSYVRINNNPADVTCRLLGRLKDETDAADVRLVLYLQMPGAEVMSYREDPPEFQEVGNCAQKLGIPYVDEFPSLRKVYEKNPTEFRTYSMIERDGQIGHKSSFGNLHVAKGLETVIRNLRISIDQKSK